jgi:AbrB family looped-hinge helix DNA binding protein
MKTLTVTAKGQVTLRKDLLRHLGVKPGQRIEIRELPGGRIEVRAAKPTGAIDDFLGSLAGKSTKRLGVDEIDEIASRGWADEA